jgi:hypothetical protein
MPDGTLQIRSYRVCFDLERRIHKLDRWRIPLPYGVPVRGMVYAGIALVAVLALTRVPVTGALLSLLTPSLRYAVLPVAIAVLLMRWSVDGRPAHSVGVSWLRLRLGPRRVSAFRPAPPVEPARLWDVPIATDENPATMRSGVVEGPCTVVLRYPARMRAHGGTMRIGQEPGPPLWRGKQLRLQAGQRMRVE